MEETSIVEAPDCLCLDAEFANGIEMIELSVFDFSGAEIYSRRFKPATLTRWDTSIHGITPDDVSTAPRFSESLGEIQPLFDRCSHILGFAVAENDIPKLAREGVKGLRKKEILELRDWFWLVYGRSHDLDYSFHISLEKCCTELGLELDPELEHSASYDTANTLKCFHILYNMFAESEGFAPGAPFADVKARFDELFAVAKDEYDRLNSAGFCSIIRRGDEYVFKVNKNRPKERKDTVATIEVASRKEAAIHFSRLFTGSLHSESFTFTRLTARKLAEFQSYTNSYDKEEQDLSSALLKLARKWT